MAGPVNEEQTGESGPAIAPTAEGGEASKLPLTLDLPSDFFPADDDAIHVKDLLLLAAIPPLAAIAWCCSDAACLKLARGVTRRLHRRNPQRHGEFNQIFRDYLPDSPGPERVAALSIEAAALHHLERFQLLRYHRPGSWRPDVAVVGKEHLDRALSQGRGAVLWVAYSAFSDMISKVALHEQGYKVWHLSRHIHGHLSSTRFGVRFLNPIRISVEGRYLASRVVIDPADPKAAVGRLEELLADNQVVSITVSALARRVTLAPFGPGFLPFAGGAPNIALKRGAPLLPLFTERRPDGSFQVTIEPPIEAPEGLSRGQMIVASILHQAGRLRHYFERLPAQFYYPSLHNGRRRCKAFLAERSRERGEPGSAAAGADRVRSGG